jgi:hypothetical protein
MKSRQAPVSLNELLDRPLIVSFNAAPCFSELHHSSHSCLVTRSVSNARINPPGDTESSIRVLRMKSKLHPVGLNEMLDLPWQ